MSGENGSSSVHGLVDFSQLPQRLWSRDAVQKYKLIHDYDALTIHNYATPSPRMLHFCPDLREYGGFNEIRNQDAISTCLNMTYDLWKPQLQEEPWQSISQSLGHLATPTAVSGSDRYPLLVVGQADGGLWQYAFPYLTRQDLTPVLRLAARKNIIAHSAPTLGDFDGNDKAEELIVGLYDGTLAFLKKGWTTLRPPIQTNLIRASPLILNPGHLLVGSETGDLLHFSFDTQNLSAPPRITPVFNELSLSVLRLALHSDGTIIIGDGRIPMLFFARLYKAEGTFILKRAPVPIHPFVDISLDAITEHFPFEVAAYPAPALADFNNDSITDLVLGDLTGALLFFDGAKPIPPQYTEK
eukprot:CAMPEP_0197317598 /NCGR_PEP_ID=MMETSP0891-20130614/47696_1 /TAXON_ID=44058 ORGANISM="Aureoumbra lagunensis, Strain CCMP1510" /NCGR_SAMPLE_ID=MMETSP0891 /ASSEMBLY_ACC=CAM_ASM_000534 /LENGTH=355 /DNA_ID=CAMNT_0042807655 /DNA_START=549 /DNA_END=1616 /DNA_ORIENTATION=-